MSLNHPNRGELCRCLQCESTGLTGPGHPFYIDIKQVVHCRSCMEYRPPRISYDVERISKLKLVKK